MKFLTYLSILFAVFLTVIGCSNLKEGQSSTEKTKKKDQLESSLLWKIEGNGAQESYLFGTMHLIEKDYFMFPETLEAKLRNSDKLVMEIAGLPGAAEAMKMVMLEEGELWDYFNEAQTDTLLKFMEAKANMTEPMMRAGFTKMKPFAVVQIATQMAFAGDTESYEMTMQAIAKEDSIAIGGLETAEDQMKIFDEMSKEEQTEMVMESIRYFDKNIELTKEMMRVYTRMNIDSLYMMVNDDESIMTVDQDKILNDRNKRWIPQISDYVKEGKTFIAVGAAHLGGDLGVINLLRNQGFTLTPITL